LSSQYISDPMQEMFIFETSQQLEQLDQAVVSAETAGNYSAETINEIFRIMHTIKSSAAMMLINNISTVAHSVEDLFYFIREEQPKNIDISALCDIVFEAVDFMKLELEKIKNGDNANGESNLLVVKINESLGCLKQNSNFKEISLSTKENELGTKQFYISSSKEAKTNAMKYYKVIVRFQDGCEMENIRAFTIIHNLKDVAEEFRHIPEDIINNNDTSEIIRKEGFKIFIKTDKSYDFMQDFFMQVAFLDNLNLAQLGSDEEYSACNSISSVNNELKIPSIDEVITEKETQSMNNNQGQSIISVNVDKLDKLMDLVGEMVIAEAMVTQNPDLRGLMLDNFSKAARQLRKITGELQDMVMSIRMVPLGPTFFKMNRVVRDMSRKLDKEVHLDIIGEDTEVDKNIIEHIGDPLMHLVRNAIDHGIETSEERITKGKPAAGIITLEARNAGSEVLIIIKDDGKGLCKNKILNKAADNGLISKSPAEMSDKEIFNLIFLPGFSTKEAVTEFSGRGVGMDVVAKNIEAVGGAIQVESYENKGTTITLKIPLTLAIIDGMNIRVGMARYTLPIVSIKESFRPKGNDVFKDPDGNEMIMIRGQCYPILRLHELYRVKTDITDIDRGIIIMLESENRTACLFADELIGEQQVVVKALPKYIKTIKKINGLAGCTLLGDGSISLILDAEGLIS
jgi:two-component system, chemotaxis family, sensor kinase CheA